MNQDPGWEQVDLEAAVRATDAAEDLELTDAQIEAIARLLFEYRVDIWTDDMLRGRHKKDTKNEKILRLRNAASTTAVRLEAMISDPALGDTLFSAYEKVPKEDSVGFSRMSTETRSVNLYEVYPSHPESEFVALVEVCERLDAVVEALDSIELDTSPFRTNKRTQQRCIELCKAIGVLLGDRSKTETADYLREFLAIVDEHPTPKTLKNWLSRK